MITNTNMKKMIAMIPGASERVTISNQGYIIERKPLLPNPKHNTHTRPNNQQLSHFRYQQDKPQQQFNPHLTNKAPTNTSTHL